MNTSGRPLSPHLTIYRWQITMVLSIIHRITGVALSVGLVALVAWLGVIAYDFIPYDPVLAFMRSLSGRVVLFGFSFAFFFHLSNGIRHLIWDTGRLFEKRQVDMSAWIVLLASVSMTLFYWLVW